MKVLHGLPEVPRGTYSIALGFFDGVHLGHQQVIRQAIQDAGQHEAKSLVITFDQHPATVVAPERVPPLIYSLPQRLRALGSLNPDFLLSLPFTRELSLKPADAFISELRERLGHIYSICVGANFVFGHRRQGNVSLLQQLGSRLEFAVHGLAAVALDGAPVSSTRVREKIAAGQLDLASQMLGRAYALSGPVVRGDGLGRKLGFPTANLDMAARVIPPNGVYAARVLLPKVLASRRAAINVGVRPSLGQSAPSRRVEAHVIGFEGDLYGVEMELELGDKRRDEQRFPSLDALKAQIARDVATIGGA